MRPKPRSPSIDELAPLRVERHVNSRIGRIRRGIIARAIKLPAGRVPFTYEQHLELAAFRVRLTLKLYRNQIQVSNDLGNRGDSEDKPRGFNLSKSIYLEIRRSRIFLPILRQVALDISYRRLRSKRYLRPGRLPITTAIEDRIQRAMRRSRPCAGRVTRAARASHAARANADR